MRWLDKIPSLLQRSKIINSLRYISMLIVMISLSACGTDGGDTEAAVQQTIAALDALTAQVEQTVAAQIAAASSTGEETQDINVSVEQTIMARDALESEAGMQTATAVSATQIAENSLSGTQTAESAAILAAQVAEDNASGTRTAAEQAAIAATQTAVSATQIAENNTSGTRTAEQTAVSIAATQTAAAPPVLLVNLPNVNLRNGPDTAYEIIDYLSEGDTVVALAKNSDESWYNVVLPNGSTGWIADSVTIPLAVSAMSKVEVAATIPPLPTSTPRPTATATRRPTATATPWTVLPLDELDSSRDPNYGSVSLSAGFTPDPYEISLISGGEMNIANFLNGSDCVGYATSAPDFRLFWSGDSDGLNFLFTANSSSNDTTLIINDPYGSWYCSDDFDGLNPGIRFSNVPTGQYDFWIGSYAADANVAGQLIITEFSIP